MRKFIFFILLLSFSFNIYAGNIKTDTINVLINDDGSADVNEVLEIPNQNTTYFEKVFFNSSDISITDLTLTDSNNTTYNYDINFSKRKINTFDYVNKKIRKIIRFNINTDGITTYYLNYKVNGMVKHYKDNIYGIDFTFESMNLDQSTDNVIINIKSNKGFYESNTVLYAFGSNSLEQSFSNGEITLTDNNYDSSKYNIRLITNTSDVSYDSVVEINDNFSNYVSKVKKESSLINYIKNNNYFSFTIIFIIIVIIVLIVFIIARLIIDNKNKNLFSDIKVNSKINLCTFNNVGYYMDVPCKYDIYEICFLSLYFNISSNPSDLISGVLLKWIFDGNIKIINKNNKYYIKFINNNFNDVLDIKLYEILNHISNNSDCLDISKIERYASSNYKEIIDFYWLCFRYIITDEINKNNITKVKNKYIMNDKIVSDANRILGLKKYMLNFNQVPRKNALTEETYKYLLISSEILGIGNVVGEEILRKNKDNILAKDVLLLEKIRYSYKKVFDISYNLYKNSHKKISIISIVEGNKHE